MNLPDRDAAHLLEEMLGDQDLAAFLENRILVRAVERMSEPIGEAARRVSDPCKQAHPEIRWRQIIGQRNILAHEYGRIEYELLYRTAVQDVPLLIRQLESLLPPLDGS